jgi:probable phosphoglycerate mutase
MTSYSPKHLPNSPTIIHFVRHGLVHNPKGIYYGRLPRYGLNAEGRTQAAHAGRYLAQRPITAIFSSPMLRARQTAAIVAHNHPSRLRPKITKLINEVHSPFDGQPSSLMEARAWDLYSGTAPEYEQPSDLVRRICSFFAHVRKNYAGNEIVAVSHGDVLVFATIWAHGLPSLQASKSELAKLMPDYYPANACVASFTFNSHNPQELPHYDYLKPYD